MAVYKYRLKLRANTQLGLLPGARYTFISAVPQ